MRSSDLVSLTRRMCSMLLVTGVLASCHDGPTDPLSRVRTLQPVDSALTVMAGAQTVVKVLVLDAGGTPVAGASVNWEASSGWFSKKTTPSNADGVAVNVWTSEGALGAVMVSASSGTAAPLQLPISVVGGYATTLKVLTDSVTFTAQGQPRLVRVVGFDAFGHPATLSPDKLGGYSAFASVVGKYVSGDTAFVEITSGYGTHRGYATVTSQDRGASAQVLLVMDPVLVGIREISGLDSVNGLAVGERAPLSVTGIDSLGHSILNANIVTAGLQLSTSDAGIATVSSDGSVTAVAPGQVTIGATAGAVSYQVPLTVYPLLDIGTQTALIELHDSNAYFQTPLSQHLTDAGVLYDLSYYVGAGALPHPETVVLRATAAGGKVSWSRSYSASYADAIADPASGIAYMTDNAHTIHAIDPTGTDRWAFDYGAISTAGCRLAGWNDGVAAACATHVFALNGDGSLAWTTAVADTAQQIISAPSLTIVRTKGSVTAIAADGSIAWSRASGATDMIADASSTIYVMDNGVRAVDPSGGERWYNAAPLADCILATSDRYVVCRNNSAITALDRSDGHVLWSATAPTSFGSMAAVSGDRILVSNAFMFALDARSGAVLGRSLNRVDETSIVVGNGVMAATSFSYGRVFKTSFTPGSEWAQHFGNAGHGNRVSP